MRFRGTCSLVILFVAIAGYVYFVEIRGGAERTKVKANESKIFLFDKDDVNSVYLKNYDNTFLLELGPSGWEMKEPVETGGDDGLVDLILTSLENSRIEKTVIDSASDLAPFGLDKPLIALSIATDGTWRDTLYMGGHNPTRSFVYSRLSGQNKVFIVPAVLFNNTSKKLLALRNKSVLDFSKDEITRVLLTREDDALLFERDGDSWDISEPISVRGDKGRIERVINGLSNLKAIEVVSEDGEDLHRYGLDPPWGRVDLFSGDKMKVESLILGNARASGNLYVKDVSRKPVFVVPPQTIRLITDDLEAFRDGRVLLFDRVDVTGITLTYPGRSITCEMDAEGKWYFHSGEETARLPADDSRIDALLSDLFDLRVEEFVGEAGSSPAAYGLDDPAALVRLTGEGGELAGLAAGRTGEDGTYLYVMNSSEDWVYTVRSELLDNIVLGANELEEDKKESLDIQ